MNFIMKTPGVAVTVVVVRHSQTIILPLTGVVKVCGYRIIIVGVIASVCHSLRH